MPKGASGPVLVAAAIILKGETVLIARRAHGSHQGGKWEFPGGKIEPGESPAGALAREIREELGVEISVGRLYAVAPHAYPEKTVILFAFICRITGGEPKAAGVADWRWVSPGEMRKFDFAEADLPVVEKLLNAAESKKKKELPGA